MLKISTLIELPAADRCCGFGGTFSVKNPEISEVMTREKALKLLVQVLTLFPVLTKRV